MAYATKPLHTYSCVGLDEDNWPTHYGKIPHSLIPKELRSRLRAYAEGRDAAFKADLNAFARKHFGID